MILGEAFVAVRPETGGFGSDLERKLTGVLAGPIGALAAIGVAAGGALFAIGASFDDAFDKIRIQTGKTGDELEGLQDSFKDVLTDVPADFGDASDAVATLNQRLGLTGDPLRQVSDQVLELSRMTGTDLKGNVDAVSDVFANWGVASESQSDKLDVLWRVSQQTGVGVAELSSAMASGGSLFRQAGLDFEDSASLLGLFEKAGLDAGSAMPAVSKAVATAAKEGKDASVVFGDVFNKIRDAKSPTEATAAAMEVFGAKAGPKLAGLISEGKLSFEDFSASVSAGGDTIMGASADTQDAAEKMRVAWNRILVAVEPVASAVFDFVGRVALAFSDALPRVFDTVAQAWDALMGGFSGEGITTAGWVGQLEQFGDTARDVFDTISQAWSEFVGGFQGDNVVGPLAELGAIARTVADFFADHWQPILIAAGVALALIAAPVTTVVAGLIALYTQSDTFRSIVDGLVERLVAFGNWLNEHRPVVAAFAAALLLITSPVVAIAAGLVLLYTKFAPFRALVDQLAASIGDFVAFFVERWDRISEAATNVFNILRVLFTGFLAVTIGPFLLLWANFGEQISAVFELAWSNVQVVVETAVRILGDLFDFLTAILTGDWGAAWAAFADIPAAVLDAVTALLGNFLTFLVDFFSSLPANVLTLLGDIGGLLLELGSTLIGGLLSGIQSAAVGLWGWFTSLPATILGFLIDAGTWLLSTGQSIAAGLLAGVVAGALAVWAWFVALPGAILALVATAATWLVATGSSLIAGFLGSVVAGAAAVWSWFTALPGVILGLLASAPTWLVNTGADVIHGLWNGIQSLSGWLAGLLGQIPGWVTSAVGSGLSWLSTAGTEALHGLWNGIESMKSWVLEQVKGIPSWIQGALSDAAHWLWDVAVSVVVGFWQGIESMKDWLWEKITGFFGSAIDAVKTLFLVFSPSRVFHQIGRYIVQGFVLGMLDEQSNATDTTRTMFSDIGASIPEAIRDGIHTGTPAVVAEMQSFSNTLAHHIGDLTAQAGSLVQAGMSQVPTIADAVSGATDQATGGFDVSKFRGLIMDQLKTVKAFRSNIAELVHGHFFELAQVAIRNGPAAAQAFVDMVHSDTLGALDLDSLLRDYNTGVGQLGKYLDIHAPAVELYGGNTPSFMTPGRFNPQSPDPDNPAATTLVKVEAGAVVVSITEDVDREMVEDVIKEAWQDLAVELTSSVPSS